MKDMEERIRQAPLRPVPESLDRRVARELNAGGPEAATWIAHPVPLWLCAVACVVFLVAGILLAPGRRDGPSGRPLVKVGIQCNDPAFEGLFARETPPEGFFLRRKTPIHNSHEGGNDA